MIGFGLILTLLGVVIISPLVAWLINAIGWLRILFGLPSHKQALVYMVRHTESCGVHFGLNLVVAMGIGSWAWGTRCRD